MFYSIDVPNPHDPEGPMIDYGSYETRELAIQAAAHHFGADDRGCIAIVSGPHGDEDGEADLTTTPCIERKFFGGRETITLEHFCRYVIQDDETAVEIAHEILEFPADGFVYNENDPEFREVFEVEHAAALKAQIDKMQETL